MDDLAIQIILFLAGIIITAIVTFFTTKHNLREHTNEKYNELKDKIHSQQVELEKLKSRDDLQQMAINGIKELWPLINDKVKNLDQ